MTTSSGAVPARVEGWGRGEPSQNLERPANERSRGPDVRDRTVLHPASRTNLDCAPVGRASQELQLSDGENIVLNFPGGYFPAKAVFCHGGALYLTTHRVLFRSHKLGHALSGGIDRLVTAPKRRAYELTTSQAETHDAMVSGSVDLPLSDVAAAGSTPRWAPVSGRRFLRIDTQHRSYLFLFSLWRPRWRTRFAFEAVKASPHASLVDGWGFYSDH